MNIPKQDGFHMPAEFEPHHGTIMIFPERPGSWAYGAREARKAFTEIAVRLSQCEQVYMLVNGPDRARNAAGIREAASY